MNRILARWEVLGFEQAINEALSKKAVFITNAIGFQIWILALKLVVNNLLLFLDVLKHVRTFWQGDEVWKHLRVLFVELTKPGKPLCCLLGGIAAFEKLIDIIVNQVVFEDAD